ncbi:putative Type 1 galactoside alpha-(1,2)-fucosyltransferase [Helianthus anomalus]
MVNVNLWAISIEPCFLAPPFLRTGTDTVEAVPHIRHCEDMSWMGLNFEPR